MKIKNANSLLLAGDFEKSQIEYRSIYKNNTNLSKSIESNLKITNLKARNFGKNKFERCAIFAGYSSENKIEEYVIYYLKKLKEICDFIVYSSDNNLLQIERKKLNGIVDIFLCERHNEYDFGSYKRGYQYLVDHKILSNYKQLIMCNDSCYGPVKNFSSKFEKMNLKGLDFWGVTSNQEFGEHIQSYFIVLNKSVFISKIFKDFINSIVSQESVQNVILKYEVGLTRLLSDNGFIYDVVLSNNAEIKKLIEINQNLTVFPVRSLKFGSELIKVKAIKQLSANQDGVINTLSQIKLINQQLHTLIVKNVGQNIIDRIEVGFSLVITTYNRREQIIMAIESALNQNYLEYEIIIVDDGSTDQTFEKISMQYDEFIQSGKIILVRFDHNKGVSHARNEALKLVKNKWVAYLDSDNILHPNFFSTYADAIMANPSANIFYAALIKKSNNDPFGFEYSRTDLESENYIDLGVLVHSNDIFKEFSFDIELKRLVDWDFILNITKNTDPIYIPKSVVTYNDISDASRISIKESYSLALSHLKNKHKLSYKISAVVIAFNHGMYLEKALESACQQIVDFDYEVIVFDDFSSDNTWHVISKMAEKYPNLIKGCRNIKNLGQAINFKNAIGAARSDFVAVLEGDDIWTDARKVQKQAEFLVSNPDAAMVFSKILVKNSQLNSMRYLKRQELIANKKLLIDDFIADESMNLIGTFSTCMFRRYVLSSLPEFVYEERLSEITVAFHSANYGYIGYLDSEMTLYHQHENGLWTGMDQESQLKGWIRTRMMAAKVAPINYKKCILELINSREH